MQKIEMVSNVTTISKKPNTNPTLNDSICRTHAIGEKRASTISPKYSGLKFSYPVSASVVDFKLPITKAS